VVTGAGSGFGRAVSLALAGRGWEVWVTDLDAANARETLALILDAGGMGQAHALDVTRRASWEGPAPAPRIQRAGHPGGRTGSHRKPCAGLLSMRRRPRAR
jgi:NAD(P)-dependent dehydrogenase (short-subunit alcohol dehydrogenase family)